MQSILTQCTQLDEEFNLLIPTIEQMIKELSIVSREFVSSKLDFLKKYSESLKSCQMDARLHRNQQTRNLIEYIKMHRQAKIKSVTQISSAKKKRKSNNNTSGYFSLQKTNSTIYHAKTITTDFDKSISIFKPANLETLKKLILKQKKSQSQVNEQMLRLINKCMNLISENSKQFPEYQSLEEEFEEIKKSNQNLSQKLDLQIKSEKVKENLKKLMESQESFKSYLNSII